jgi:hypothetical protein
LISIHFDAQDRIVAIKSDFGYGGIPLRGIHQTGFCPKGEFPVKGRQLRVGAFQLRQNEEELEIWFSTGNQLPRDHWTDQRDAESGVRVWLSQQTVQAGHTAAGVVGRTEIQLFAGLAVEFRRTAAEFPITSIRLSPDDFK